LIFFNASRAIPKAPTLAKEDAKVEIPFFANFTRNAMANFSGGFNTDQRLLNIQPLVHIIFDGQTEWVLAGQELIMILAHLEVFIADTLTAVWQIDSKLLEATYTGRKELKQRSLSSLNLLSTQDFAELTERAVWDMMRKSSEAYLNYLQDTLQLKLKTDSRLIYLAGLNRNAIVHNGGMISQKYIDYLNPKEKRNAIINEPVPVNEKYMHDVFNTTLSFGEQIFEELSKKYFGIGEPLKASERISKRQDPALPDNPLFDIATQAIINIGGPDKAIADPEKAKAEIERLLRDKGKNNL
jgi:hypothetical protein